MFGGIQEVMKVLTGGPDAIKNVLKTVAPEVYKALHAFFADKVELRDGESSFIVGITHANDMIIVMALVVHDETHVCRIASKYTIEIAIDSIPAENLKISKMLGK